MTRQLVTSLLCLTLFFAGAAAQGQAASSSPSAQRRQQINPYSLTGTYRSGRSEWRVLALGGNRLRVEFSGTWESSFRLESGERVVHEGEASGVVTLEGDTATLQNTECCRITLRFVGRRLIVNQTGSDIDWGFGMYVSADGTYIKRSNIPPRFQVN